MTDDTPFTMLELEEQLQTDASGQLRDRLLAELQDQAQQIKRQLDRGVPPQEFQTLSRLQAALEAASLTVKVVWLNFHPQSA